VRDVERLLYLESGLLGMSGLSSDMRDLLTSDAPAARVAVDVFAYRVRRELGSLAAALGGLDAIVFTAGIGENQPEVRRRICEDAAWLGVELDHAANARGERRVSTSASRVAVYVVPTDEELMIARHVVALLG
jgi:acetate kinase